MNSGKLFRDQVNVSYPSINEEYSQSQHYKFRDQYQQKNNHHNRQEKIIRNQQINKKYHQNNIASNNYLQKTQQFQGIPVQLNDQQFIQNQPPCFNNNMLYNDFNQQVNSIQLPAVNLAPISPRIIRTRITRLEATMQGQSYPCQKCGHSGYGAINYRTGSTACLWGIGLFMFTGVFWWIPCVCDRCKNIDIHCGRCGYRKAIVSAECCC